MKRLSYTAMRRKILDTYPLMRDTAVFTPELLTAIFWEESGFRNIPQDSGPAVGFGQVEPGTLSLANVFYKTHYKPADILADEYRSIIISNHVLSMLYHNLHHSRRGALEGYAGVRSRPVNAPIPGRWMACEDALLKIHAADLQAGGDAIYGLSISSSDVEGIKQALRLAKPNSNPNDAFPNNS